MRLTHRRRPARAGRGEATSTGGSGARSRKKAEQAAERKKQKRLDELARDIDGAWSRLEELVATSAYDDAVKLAVEIRDLAARQGEGESFQARFAEMRKRQIRRRPFYERWSRVNPREKR